MSYVNVVKLDLMKRKKWTSFQTIINSNKNDLLKSPGQEIIN